MHKKLCTKSGAQNAVLVITCSADENHYLHEGLTMTFLTGKTHYYGRGI